MGDDGIGIHAVRKLSEMEMPEGVTIIDAGTACLNVLNYIEDANRLIVLDAISAEDNPGTIYRMDYLNDQDYQSYSIDSLHSMGILHVLEMARNKPEEIYFLGIQPAILSFCVTGVIAQPFLFVIPRSSRGMTIM